jgi:hypothetical protein
VTNSDWDCICLVPNRGDKSGAKKAQRLNDYSPVYSNEKRQGDKNHPAFLTRAIQSCAGNGCG